MGYRSLVLSEVRRALSVGGYLQDIPIQVTYRPSAWMGAFDPATQTSSGQLPGKLIDVVIVESMERQTDNVNVFPGDKDVLVSTWNLQAAGLPIPEIDDTLMEADETLLKVVRVSTDPTKSLYILQSRKP